MLILSELLELDLGDLLKEYHDVISLIRILYCTIVNSENNWLFSNNFLNLVNQLVGLAWVEKDKKTFFDLNFILSLFLAF